MKVSPDGKSIAAGNRQPGGNVVAVLDLRDAPTDFNHRRFCFLVRGSGVLAGQPHAGGTSFGQHGLTVGRPGS